MMSLFLQEHLNVILEDLDISGEESVRISKDIKNMTEQLGDKEKELQYTPKYKKSEGRAYSTVDGVFWYTKHFHCTLVWIDYGTNPTLGTLII
jgi:hypothetical protein